MNPARLVVLCVMLTGLSRTGRTEMPKPAPHDLWWKTERSLTEILKEHDLHELVTSPDIRKPTSDPAELLRRLQLFVRAGHREEAGAAITGLAKVRAGLPAHLLVDAAMFLLGREEWELSRVFLETFPHIQAGWDTTLFRHWKEQGKTIEDIDAWIAKRQPANPGYWVEKRIGLRAENGTDGALIGELADAVRARPADPERVILYLDATSHREETPEWLGEAFRPKRALDAYHVGSRLIDRAPEAAVKLLERANDMEITEAQIREASRTIQRVLAPGEARKMLIAWFRQGLVRACQKTGRDQKAQEIMELLVRDGGDGIVHATMAQMAGQVQGASGARVVEQRIRKDEEANQDAPRYWLSRANYFAGRREDDEAVRAYEKALELASIEKKRRHKVMDVRFEILVSYERHLIRMKKLDAADRLLHRELEQVPHDAITARRAAAAILALDSDHKLLVQPGDPVLWSYLKRIPKWDYTEEQVLWKLLDRTPEADKEKALRRALRLTRGKHATRAKITGWILTRMGQGCRAIPLLRDAVRRLKKKDELESARFTLFEACLDTGDWRAAEKLFPRASARLTGKELPRWYASIAVLAAKKGARADALRIWKKVSNLDPADLHRLDEIAAAGMKQELTDFYRAMAERDPASWIPERALEILEVGPG